MLKDVSNKSYLLNLMKAIPQTHKLNYVVLYTINYDGDRIIWRQKAAKAIKTPTVAAMKAVIKKGRAWLLDFQKNISQHTDSMAVGEYQWAKIQLTKILAGTKSTDTWKTKQKGNQTSITAESNDELVL